MKSIAIIPARIGSKRIYKKNIKLFLGKPIIFYAIQAALESQIFDEIIVSTDSEEIANIATNFGASVPFLRSKKNSDDLATTVDVLLEVFEKYKEKGFVFDLGCCIYPTAVFTTKYLLHKAKQILVEENWDCIFPIVPYSSPIQRALKIKENKSIEMFSPEYLHTSTQNLPKTYFDSGQFYFFKVDKIISKKKLLTDNTTAIILNPSEIQDINDEEDWKIAEIKYKLLNNKS